MNTTDRSEDQRAPVRVGSDGSGSPFSSLVALGLISFPEPKSKRRGGWNRGTAKQKTATMCAHHSCRRERNPGRKICEHHLRLQRARNNRWAASAK